MKITFIIILEVFILCHLFGCTFHNTSLENTLVTVTKVEKVTKTIEYDYKRSRAPNYCSFFGGMGGGFITGISCIFYDFVPDETVTETEIQTVYRITLDTGEILYTKDYLQNGSSILREEIKQARVITDIK